MLLIQQIADVESQICALDDVVGEGGVEHCSGITFIGVGSTKVIFTNVTGTQTYAHLRARHTVVAPE